MITFLKVLPNEIDFLSPQAVEYLQNAIDRTPASTSRLDVTIDIAKKGYGNVYLIFNDNELTGVAYILVYSSLKGKVVAPVLVGGDNMHIWQQDFFDFVNNFSMKLGADKVRWIGRKGWKKAYPKARVIGYIFEHDVG